MSLRNRLGAGAVDADQRQRVRVVQHLVRRRDYTMRFTTAAEMAGGFLVEALLQ